jgi:hypothetical protein
MKFPSIFQVTKTKACRAIGHDGISFLLMPFMNLGDQFQVEKQQGNKCFLWVVNLDDRYVPGKLTDHPNMDSAQSYAIEISKKFHPGLLIQSTPLENFLAPHYQHSSHFVKPEGFKTPLGTPSRVTLLGDGCHPMTSQGFFE